MSSAAKNTQVLGLLSVRPVPLDLKWKELAPALESLGNLELQKGERYLFTRNGSSLNLIRSQSQVVGEEQIIQLRHFLAKTKPEEAA